MYQAYYHVAQVCLNGHTSNSSADDSPERNKDFCDECGESTIHQCPSCGAAIRGRYEVPGVISIGSRYQPPAYCFKCGKPFPWTERRISAAMELAAEELSENEIGEFRESLSDVSRDTPRLQVGVVRMKKLLGKMSQPVVSGIRDIVIDVISEAAKKAIWPDRV